jgi:hypothetical protein
MNLLIFVIAMLFILLLGVIFVEIALRENKKIEPKQTVKQFLKNLAKEKDIDNINH